MDNSFVEKMLPGTNFQDRLFAKSNTEKKGNGNGPDLKMTLNDCSGTYFAKKWHSTEAECGAAFLSRFVIVSGKVEIGTKYEGEIDITLLVAADEPDDIEMFLPLFPLNHKESVTRFSDMMKSVREPNLSQLLRVIFNRSDFTWKQFKSASAAQMRHHAYRGGLIEHSVEVAQCCDKICSVLPHLKRDLLITGALLHDIGKLDEMDHGLGMGEFTECGTMVGHVGSGALFIHDAINQVPGFPKTLRHLLTNMVLSHHGQPEWGAAKTPACPESFVLHYCDNISAKANECHRLKASAAPGQFSVKRGPGEYLYVGDYGLQEMEPAVEVPTLPLQVETIQEMPAQYSFTTVRLPIMSVAAGSPDQSSDEIQDFREVIPPAGGADHLFKVTGDSMIGAGIFDGDLLFVKQQAEVPKDGEIVVANVASHGSIVKRFRRDPFANEGKGQVWLDSENPAPEYQPIRVAEDTRIQGRVVGLLRDF